MYRYILHITIISCFLFCIACNDNDTPPGSDTGPYNVGDIISDDDLAMQFDFCYPSCVNNPDSCEDLTTDEADTTFSFTSFVLVFVLYEIYKICHQHSKLLSLFF